MIITKNNIQDVFKCKKADKEKLLQKGYILLKECFVDNSGLESERGLITAFISDLTAEVEKHHKVYCYLTNIGQFQVYVGIFKRG